jgi:hypothetical protein
MRAYDILRIAEVEGILTISDILQSIEALLNKSRTGRWQASPGVSTSFFAGFSGAAPSSSYATALRLTTASAGSRLVDMAF